ncbi:hypothetical protein BGZ63DRAFT_101707 [Mariannaea sp. PMI_226]|nr:hypothetical protein BGZ63DRAFT_101707 [Mariannaea sp. PMI_226]
MIFSPSFPFRQTSCNPSITQYPFRDPLHMKDSRRAHWATVSKLDPNSPVQLPIAGRNRDGKAFFTGRNHRHTLLKPKRIPGVRCNFAVPNHPLTPRAITTVRHWSRQVPQPQSDSTIHRRPSLARQKKSACNAVPKVPFAKVLRVQGRVDL